MTRTRTTLSAAFACESLIERDFAVLGVRALRGRPLLCREGSSWLSPVAAAPLGERIRRQFDEFQAVAHVQPLADEERRRRVRHRSLAVRAAAASSRACPSTADNKGKEVTHSFPFQFYSAQGACGKPRVVPHNRRLRPEPTEMGVAKCVCCCRRMGRAWTSNRWLGSRCSCGHSARRCRCARRGLRGAAGRHRRRGGRGM